LRRFLRDQLFAVDTGNGSILGLLQTTSGSFDPASSGTVDSGTVSQRLR